MLEHHTRNTPAEQLFAAMPKAIDRAAWDKAMAEFNQLKCEADDLYERTVVADQAFYAARDAVPHVVLADERDAEIERLDKLHGWSAAHDTYEAAIARQCDAEGQLLRMPAPDGEALMWKVESLYKPGDGLWGEGVEDQTHADLRRFLLTGRA
jgi:hypothetical protein